MFKASFMCALPKKHLQKSSLSHHLKMGFAFLGKTVPQDSIGYLRTPAASRVSNASALT
jgi:hypothetical protein